MMHAYSGHPQQLSVCYPNLVLNTNYSLMLAVYTMAGNASENIAFGKTYFYVEVLKFCSHLRHAATKVLQ